MTDVMQQDGQLHCLTFLCGDLDTLVAEAVQCFAHQVIGAQRMLETGMSCTRIDHIGHAQLTDMPESLEPRMTDDLEDQRIVNGYETVKRVVDDLAFHGA